MVERLGVRGVAAAVSADEVERCLVALIDGLVGRADDERRPRERIDKACAVGRPGRRRHGEPAAELRRDEMIAGTAGGGDPELAVDHVRQLRAVGRPARQRLVAVAADDELGRAGLGIDRVEIGR